jgi:hypothetical protein
MTPACTCSERLATAEREKLHAQQDAKRAMLRARSAEAAAKRKLDAAQAELAAAVAEQKRQADATEVRSAPVFIACIAGRLRFLP